ncbi:hypothetical protein CYY_007692 [Polysphondylium violaceum]|uniref:Transmembrane protein n=1 Tax=Polysphondylium violaceum TaxID=133409 RepID=A0A8J4V208_9MYCE|nr:hypothetical protein CYY_007692 [Polysphondylium violaceum]
MNTVKVKQLKNHSCATFEGFRKDYPQPLYGVLTPTEFESMITRFNTLSHTKASKKIFIPIATIFLGFILIAVSFVKTSVPLGIIGAIIFVGSFVATVILGCAFTKRLKNNIGKAIFEANNYFADRRITFVLKEKIPKGYHDHHHDHHHHNQNHHNKQKKKQIKYYIEITFPAPQVPGGMGAFIAQTVAPIMGFVPQMGVQPQVGVSQVGYNPHSNTINVGLNSNLAPGQNFNVSIDADQAARVASAGLSFAGNVAGNAISNTYMNV